MVARFRLFAGFSSLALSLLGIGSVASAQAAPKQQPDPQMQAVLDQLQELKGKPIEQCTPVEARTQPTPADAVMALMKKNGVSMGPLEKDIATDDKNIKGTVGEIPVRIYQPRGDGPFPVVVYYHGGGFVIATIESYDASCRALAYMANAVVVSVEYRKAPEYQYPAAVDDSFAAYKWATQNAKDIKGDPSKIAVAGESAGGNLATVVCMKAKEAGAPMPIFQLLIYPVTNDDMNTPSYQANVDAKPLNKAMMAWFFKYYLANPASAGDPHVCPLKATNDQLSGLPPAMVITDSIDPLMSEGKMYADKLQSAGVQVQYKNYDGVTHEFFGMGLVVDKAKQAEMDATSALKSAFDSHKQSADARDSMAH